MKVHDIFPEESTLLRFAKFHENIINRFMHIVKFIFLKDLFTIMKQAHVIQGATVFECW